MHILGYFNKWVCICNIWREREIESKVHEFACNYTILLDDCVHRNCYLQGFIYWDPHIFFFAPLLTRVCRVLHHFYQYSVNGINFSHEIVSSSPGTNVYSINISFELKLINFQSLRPPSFFPCNAYLIFFYSQISFFINKYTR